MLKQVVKITSARERGYTEDLTHTTLSEIYFRDRKLAPRHKRETYEHDESSLLRVTQYRRTNASA